MVYLTRNNVDIEESTQSPSKRVRDPQGPTYSESSSDENGDLESHPRVRHTRRTLCSSRSKFTVLSDDEEEDVGNAVDNPQRRTRFQSKHHMRLGDIDESYKPPQLKALAVKMTVNEQCKKDMHLLAVPKVPGDVMEEPTGKRQLFGDAPTFAKKDNEKCKKVQWCVPVTEVLMKKPAEKQCVPKGVASSSSAATNRQDTAVKITFTEAGHLEAAQKVKTILRHFNSYYLRFVQEEENRCRKEESEKLKIKAKSKEEGKEKKKSRRPDLKAITQMKADKKMEDRGKVLGHVPGINVGDQFFSRCEMVAIGLHCHWLGGIDTIPASARKTLPFLKNITKLPVASSIMLSGAYEDDIDNSDDVIYTGSGGNDLLGRKHQIADQVLKRGNLALTYNMEQDLPVRLIRGHKTKKSYTGKIYTYDGLYKVKDFWAEKGLSGFTVYKFRLKRVDGQSILTTNQVHFVSGHILPANIAELKGLVCLDISNGLERTPIPATNLQNPPLAPTDFRYTAKIEARKGVRKPLPAKGCSCRGACYDPNKCSCAVLNKKSFPYVTQNGGRLVEPMDVVYECGPNCGCDESCSNRVTQKGMQYRLEVFRTANKGWGVRSWDTIPAGAPVCQYTGLLMRTEDADHVIDNDVYVFDLDCIQTMKGIGRRQRRLISKGNEDESEDVATDYASEEPEYCIDAANCGNVSRFINHCCEPNLFVQCVLNDHHDLSQPCIWFFAADTIHPLEELSYDYGYELNSVVKDGKVKVMHCYCGAHGCRKRLL
ncbi:hypothetical protein GOP47_0012384 [Adiantum capillus-veneris]|uniref:Histone-lysine N-methyltransferase, H3 lysine-9 specific SUVH4 n=1 Tax=Adiantum capillus-veneris TaxID=13818 RepID=A0A9D4ZE93_ADICA|nr:hypothetical protein GOP47_0012384 [Adiantum capillus-veneris]